MKKFAGVVLMVFALALIVLPTAGVSNGGVSIMKSMKDPGGGR